MIAYLMTWLKGLGKPQPVEVLTNTTASTSTKKRGRPKLSKSAAGKTVQRKKNK